MESNGKVAKAQVTINASAEMVWNALVDPKIIKEYMFGATVSSQWTPGSKIVWKGEWKGKAYEDRGVIIQITPKKILQYTHFSPLSGQADIPENYHTVTMELVDNQKSTQIFLSQDKNASEDERKHAEENWSTMLKSLKKILESGN
jgi:uncharacterized protein YndB with AHSA1/START domain